MKISYMENTFYKIVVYNYLDKFSKIETYLKQKFEEELREVADSEIKNNFILLHLSEEIKVKFGEDIQNSSFHLKKINYKNDLDKIKIKWNLKKRIKFAKKHGLMSNILSEINHLQKRESLSVAKIIEDAIQIRNCLAHETFKIELSPRFELLSDEKLKEMVKEDTGFSSSSNLAELDSNYKHALTYYFYLQEIEKLI